MAANSAIEMVHSKAVGLATASARGLARAKGFQKAELLATPWEKGWEEVMASK